MFEFQIKIKSRDVSSNLFGNSVKSILIYVDRLIEIIFKVNVLMNVLSWVSRKRGWENWNKESGTNCYQFILFWARKMNLLLAHMWQSITRQHLLVQSKQSRHQKNVRNLLNVSAVVIINFEQISAIILVFPFLALNQLMHAGKNLLHDCLPLLLEILENIR